MDFSSPHVPFVLVAYGISLSGIGLLSLHAYWRRVRVQNRLRAASQAKEKAVLGCEVTGDGEDFTCGR